MSINIKMSIFTWVERFRRLIHFRLTSAARRLSTKRSESEMAEYYKLYDAIYKLSDTPEFVCMYKNREMIQADFNKLCDKNLIPKTGRLLDLGCGEGSNVIYFQSRGYSASGVDVSENAIRLAKDNALKLSSEADFRVADVIEMKVTEKKYDVCTDVGCLHMLVYASHRMKYLKAIRQQMASHGVFYLFQTVAEKDVEVANEEKAVADSVSFKHRRMLDNGDVVEYQGCGGLTVSLPQYCKELEAAGFSVKHAELVRTPAGLFASLLAVHSIE